MKDTPDHLPGNEDCEQSPGESQHEIARPPNVLDRVPCRSRVDQAHRQEKHARCYPQGQQRRFEGRTRRDCHRNCGDAYDRPCLPVVEVWR